MDDVLDFIKALQLPSESWEGVDAAEDGTAVEFRVRPYGLKPKKYKAPKGLPYTTTGKAPPSNDGPRPQGDIGPIHPPPPARSASLGVVPSPEGGKAAKVQESEGGFGRGCCR